MFANTDLIEAVANRHFTTLTHLEPVWDEQYDEPWYSTGKMGIVFKLSDPATGQRFALKVFKERDAEREERLRQIAEQLAAYPSPYWVSYQFLADEIRLESLFTDDETACVLLMEWIEGQTMGQFVRDTCGRTDRAALHKLAYAFDQMALWLLANPFAHGDLKHDNIIIRPNGVPALVDYDGLFFPVFTDLQALELGTPDYQHPKRTAHHFGLYLDDFSLLVISLSLYALSHRPDLYAPHNTGENLILTLADFEEPRRSQLLSTLQEMEVTPVRQRLALLDYALVLPPQSLPGLEVLLRDKVGHYATLQTLSRPTLPDLIPYRKGKKWGFCDRNKRIAIECIYDWVELFEEGMARVKQNDEWGFIDRVGKQVVSCQFYRNWGFSEGLRRIGQGGKLGFVDKTGKQIIPCQFYKVRDFSEGLAAVKRADREPWGYINKRGDLVIDFHFYDADSFSDGLAKVEGRGGSGFIDTTGKLVIQDQFKLTRPFHEGMAAVNPDGGKWWGFIDKTGRMVIPCQFDHVGSFSEGLAQVQQGGKWGFIDRKGNLIILYQFVRSHLFSEGLALVSQGEGWGFIDKKGNLSIPYQFDDVEKFYNGLARVTMDIRVGNHYETKICGYIDQNGNQYWEEAEEKDGHDAKPFDSSGDDDLPF